MEHVNQLNKLIKPHLLRREKDDVENSIPGMKETLLYVEITNLQKMCYRAVLERNRELLLRGAGSGAGGVASTFNNISMMLRHCCNHPWLITEVEEGALVDLDESYGTSDEASPRRVPKRQPAARPVRVARPTGRRPIRPRRGAPQRPRPLSDAPQSVAA